MADEQSGFQEPCGQHTRAFIQALCNLKNRQGPVTRQIETATGGLAAQGVHDGPGHVFVPDEYKGAVRAPDGQQAGFFKQRGDLVVDAFAQDGADAQHGLQQLRVGLAVLRQHLFDQAFVVAVGKALVAAQGHVFGEPVGVVGVVAIGRAAGRDHDVLHAVRHARLQHVARAFHIDRVFKGAVGVFAGCDDGRQVHQGVDAVCRHSAA